MRGGLRKNTKPEERSEAGRITGAKLRKRKIKKEYGRLSRESAVFISETCSSPSLRYFFKSLYLIGGASISICVFAKKSGRKNSTVSANYASYDNPFVDVFYVPLFE